MRALFRSSIVLILGASLLPASVGCHYLNFLPKPAPGVAGDKTAGEPGKSYHRIPPYVFLADFDIDTRLPLFRELTSLRDQVSAELHLPTTDKLIRVYLFENRTRYEQYMNEHFPELPTRQAFFVAWPKLFGGVEDLRVYTCWGDRIQQDLRHELTHALLHSVLLDVPMWLDEGLAEYFENPQNWNGINQKYLQQLQNAPLPFQPDLARLETVKKVHEMNAAEYREAWAWVHFMLRGNAKAKQVLLAYLHDLRTDRQPGPLRPRLQAAVPDLEQALLQHLKKLDAGKATGPY
jgi:hypothetical protein